MDVSVVVPTLNARDQLSGCLDALTEHVSGAEIVVVNGPSSDGTTGMVRERDDVDVLIELADRRITVARNAGIDRATGDVIAFIDHTATVSAVWKEAIESGLETTPVVTGPTTSQIDGGNTLTAPESRTIAGRNISYFNPGNVAFERTVLDELDGFDEYLHIGGSRDMAHRLASRGFDITWDERLTITSAVGADGGEREPEWGWKYRSLAYRLVKNYNLRPTVLRRLLGHAGADCLDGLREVGRGETPPSEWLGTGKTVVTNLGGGIKAGVSARRRDRTARRNPAGRSARNDRAVTVYDWR